jgi:hypothetical protein
VTSLLLAVVYAGLEYWLGKTQRVKAGSVLEIAVQVARVVLQRRK